VPRLYLPGLSPLAQRLAILVVFSGFALVSRAEGLPSPDQASKLAPAPRSATSPAKAWDHAVPFAQHVRDAAKAANVRPELLHALIHAESGYQPGARSPSGAVGLMQLMPGVLQRYNVRDPLDPRQNIHAGARYVRALLDLFEDNVSLVLAAYNAGEYAVIRAGNRIPPFGQTRAFVPKVMALYDKNVSAAAANEVAGD
jgi:soluble lytic murein transglycosylase-like protein